MRKLDELVKLVLEHDYTVRYENKGYAYQALHEDFDDDSAELWDDVALTDEEQDEYSCDISIAIENFLMNKEGLDAGIKTRDEVITSLFELMVENTDEADFRDYVDGKKLSAAALEYISKLEY